MAQPSNESDVDKERLRQEYEALPKTPHGDESGTGTRDVHPEWVISVLENPYQEWNEINSQGEYVTIIVGSVPECRQWIKLVFIGTLNSMELQSAYQDRRLERRFGGRPWRSTL